MRARLVRVALLPWIALYFLLFRSIFVAPMIFYFGVPISAAVVFLAVGIWSSAFYLLLCKEGSLDRIQAHLARLKEKQEQGLVAKIKKRLSRHLDEEALLSPLWILVIFTLLGALGGVLALRLARPDKANGRTLSLIWLGCAIDVFFWTVLVYGIPITLARELIGGLLGGG